MTLDEAEALLVEMGWDAKSREKHLRLMAAGYDSLNIEAYVRQKATNDDRNHLPQDRSCTEENHHGQEAKSHKEHDR